jgi:hypothetical protein
MAVKILKMERIMTKKLMPHHPSVLRDQRGGRGSALRIRRAIRRNPLVKKEVLERATFLG